MAVIFQRCNNCAGRGRVPDIVNACTHCTNGLRLVGGQTETCPYCSGFGTSPIPSEMDCPKCNGTGEIRDRRAERQQDAEERKQEKAARKAGKTGNSTGKKATRSTGTSEENSLRSFKSRMSTGFLAALFATPFLITDSSVEFFSGFFPDAPELASFGVFAVFGFLLPRITMGLLSLLVVYFLYAVLS